MAKFFPWFFPTTSALESSAKVLDMATQLHVKVAGTEVEVTWTLIASPAMSLGSNFVRPPSHLPKSSAKHLHTTWYHFFYLTVLYGLETLVSEQSQAHSIHISALKNAQSKKVKIKNEKGITSEH